MSNVEEKTVQPNNKINIGEKIFKFFKLIVILLILIFWREIYYAICYLDICNKYLVWQEEIAKTGIYSVYTRDNDGESYEYYTKDKYLENLYANLNSEEITRAIVYDSDIEGTKIFYYTGADKEDGKREVYKTYVSDEVYGNINRINFSPIRYLFTFENDVNLLDLMKTIKEVRHIRIENIDNQKYYIVTLTDDSVLYIDQATGLLTQKKDTNLGIILYTIRVGNISDEIMNFPNPENDYVIWNDYEFPDRNFEKTTEKISNCDAEAGTIVSFDFKVPNDGNSSLEGFKETKEDNLMIMKITNNITYKKMQERWDGLRDLTDEDFKNYFVMLVIDKDKTKEISFSKYGNNGTNPTKLLTMKETEATSDYKYSGSLVIIPNNEEMHDNGVRTVFFDAEIE